MNDVEETHDRGSFKVLADARCREHPWRSIGVALLAPGGFPSWEARHEGRASHVLYGSDRHRNTLFVNLRETSLTEVEGWCRDCRKVRAAKVADLLDAARLIRRAIVLV